MDAAEDDRDIKLQKLSVDFIAEFDKALTPFLRKPDGAGGSRLRSRVRVHETARLISTVSNTTRGSSFPAMGSQTVDGR